MRLLDLFSGIGGFSLAASWVWGDELEIVGFVEIDKFCQKVLKKHWPDVPIYEDIKNVRGEQFGTVDLVTGGFPCQPFSVAGKRKGKADDRYLWPEMFRVIQEVKPRWVIGENVTGIINMELDKVLSDLENADYETETFIIPACGVNAPHKRDRIWVVANTSNNGCSYRESLGGKRQNKMVKIGKTMQNKQNRERWECESWEIDESFTDTTSHRLQGELQQNSRKETGAFKAFCAGSIWESFAEYISTPIICRGSDGIPDRMDRLKSLGNAIVPQVVYPIMKAIKEIENGHGN